MATSKDYRDYLAEQLSGTDTLLRPMMGEYVLYCGGRVVGGLYDNRLPRLSRGDESGKFIDACL